jgi:uncharacterized membrane protein YgcG
MKNFLLFCLFLLFFVTGYPQQLLYDEADLLTPSEKGTIISKLKEIHLRYDVDIRCYIAKSLNGKSPDEYTLAKANELKIGTIGLNNGIFILVAPREEQFLISNSLGVQWILTDKKTEGIIDSQLGTFKSKKYPEGILKCLESINKGLAGYNFQVSEAFLAKTDFTKLQGKVIAFDCTPANVKTGSREPMPADAQFDPAFKISLSSGSRKIADLYYSKYMGEMINAILASKKILIFARVRKVNPTEFELLGVMNF